MLSNPVLKSGLISGSLSLAGDLIAQILTNRDNTSGTAAYDGARAARMGSFGLFLYGPYQHYWYRALDRAMPVRNMPNFLAKVTLNQLCLAPVVIAGVFAWNLALQNKIKEFPHKTRRDFVPTLFAGWKFWVPAASVNFLTVPLQHQVLYMSLCGVVWTGYLSYSSALATQLQTAGGGGAKGGKREKK
jgi:protein Mpv17